MIIDFIFLIVVLFAVIKGISRGLIVAVFSLLAIIIGLAAALKFSYIVTGWLSHSINTSSFWLPFLSFLIVLFIVVLIVRWAANLLQAAVSVAMLGWLNKLGGILLYLIIYLSVYSVFLFYLSKMNIIKPDIIASSKTYFFIEPLGPKAIDLLGYIIPVFKDLFLHLSNFFDTIKIKSA